MSNNQQYTLSEKVGVGAALVGAGVLAYVAFNYRICNPNQYIIKTGLGIPDMLICKRGVIWPFQKYQLVLLNPNNYTFELHHMSRDKVPFNLPISLTVGPYNPEEKMDLFKNFARKMTREGGNDEDVENTVKSVANGEIRVLSASRSIDDLFSDRKIFRSCIVDEVQKDLDQFGLQIFNANIEEMKDLPGNSYFEFRKKRAIESANNEARVDVAEAVKKGEIGEKENQAIASQTVAKYTAETIKIQNEQALLVAYSTKELEVKKADFKRETEIAKVTAIKEAEKREIELQEEVEKRRIKQKEEALRAVELTQATVTAESNIAEAKGNAEALRQTADAKLYTEQKNAEAKLALAQADAKGIELKLVAEANGIGARGHAEADAILAKYNAESQGMKMVMNSCGNDIELIKFNLALQAKLPQQLAESNAKAIHDMKPSINIWQKEGDLDPIANLAMAIPQIAKTVQQQTGIELPKFLVGNRKN